MSEVPLHLLSQALCFPLSLSASLTSLFLFFYDIDNHSVHLLSIHYLLGAARLVIH